MTHKELINLTPEELSSIAQRKASLNFVGEPDILALMLFAIYKQLSKTKEINKCNKKIKFLEKKVEMLEESSCNFFDVCDKCK